MSKDTALMIIDMQVNLLTPAYHADEVLANINELLAQARRSETPVIYVQHDGPQGDDLEVDTPGWQIHPAIAPRDTELIVHKRASDAFHATPLKQELDQRGIKHLVVVGGQTEYCVDTTVRRATTCGYNVTLVQDAHTTLDSMPWLATQIIAYHNDILDRFTSDDYMITVLPTSKIAF